MKEILIELIIILADIKDYLFYLFERGGDNLVSIAPVSAGLLHKSKHWLHLLKKALPQAEVVAHGSVALGIPGQKDLDYAVGYNGKNIYEEKLSALLGQPLKTKLGFTEWIYLDKDCSIEVCLADKNNRWYQRVTGNQKILQSNNRLLNKYKNLKLQMNGKRYKEYDLKKTFLFNMIYYKYGNGLDILFRKKSK